MSRPKSKRASLLLDQMLDEASWLLSHAEALASYGRRDDAHAEFARAAICEEQVACLLEADGQDREAAIHRASAAACHETVGQYVRAVTLLRAALSSELPEEYCTRITEQRTRCVAQAQKEIKKATAAATRKQASAMS
jgi:hypothetical protein